jgi:hypothetical protein
VSDTNQFYGYAFGNLTSESDWFTANGDIAYRKISVFRHLNDKALDHAG